MADDGATSSSPRDLYGGGGVDGYDDWNYAPANPTVEVAHTAASAGV